MEEPSSIQSADSHWLESIKIELAELSPLSSSWTICRVPTKLRNTNKDAYTPHIISVGPIHHEERSLKGMEAHKWRYMLSLLERTQNAVATLDACGKAILRFDNDVRASYAEWINYSNTDLAKMMLLDGCFILELLLRYSNPDPKLQSDPIFTTSWMILTLQRDLALLENQIPFFVLEWLFNFTVRRTANGLATPSLPDLALRFFRSSINNVNEETLGAGGRQNSHHLLHLIHNCYFPSSPRIETKGKRNSNNIEFIHCAAALKEAGIWFEKDDTKSLFDLEFRNDALFRNFIAFEQCFQESSQYITSYVLLMDRLIDTAKDVEVLERRRIVANDLGGRDDVAAMFNNICKQIVLRDFYFAGLCEQVNEYYHRRWNRYKASLKRDYCTNPWTIISLLGAFILISLTAVQTVYSVLGYYPH
ncbi:unnamed protein product [Linum tenue]|uniref:Uncharacterized protein n=1 Tax=Linum tenue TaxID=586396 RepID=A0AAV0QWP7_9ROSI|nr:unnamed protein product [Linum tenue]